MDAEIRIYQHLFTQENPADVPEGMDWKELLNPDSLKVLHDCKLEPSLAEAQPGDRFQFERNGYFCVDSKDSAAGKRVFNRTVALKDAWTKSQKKQA